MTIATDLFYRVARARKCTIHAFIVSLCLPASRNLTAFRSVHSWCGIRSGVMPYPSPLELYLQYIVLKSVRYNIDSGHRYRGSSLSGARSHRLPRSLTRIPISCPATLLCTKEHAHNSSPTRCAAAFLELPHIEPTSDNDFRSLPKQKRLSCPVSSVYLIQT